MQPVHLSPVFVVSGSCIPQRQEIYLSVLVLLFDNFVILVAVDTRNYPPIMSRSPIFIYIFISTLSGIGELALAQALRDHQSVCDGSDSTRSDTLRVCSLFKKRVVIILLILAQPSNLFALSPICPRSWRPVSSLLQAHNTYNLRSDALASNLFSEGGGAFRHARPAAEPLCRMNGRYLGSEQAPFCDRCNMLPGLRVWGGY